MSAPFLIPYSLGKLELKNRLVLAPMTTWASQDNGEISPDELPYLQRRAGQYGITMTAACYIHPNGKAFEGQWGCSDDRFLPSLSSVAKVIKGEGSAAILQIHHGGRQCPATLCGGRPLSASAIPYPREGAPVPFAMTEDEIQESIAAFAAAAKRGQEAGFDGIEIHGANTYLLQQFVSPHSNRREDAWGEDRLRYPLAVTRAVRAAVGPDFPVGYRFSPEETTQPGLSIADTEALLSALIQLPLAFLHVSLTRYDQSSLREDYEGATLTRLAKLIDGKIPLIGVGSVKTANDVERGLDLGADMVAVGKVGLSDPEWVDGMREGREPVLRFKRENLAEQFTLPKGLAHQMTATLGRFDFED